MKIIKFGAIWCSGCLVMRPRWKDIEKEFPNLETHYYDFDTEKEAVAKYGINDKLPVFIFFDKSENEIIRLVGEQSKNYLVSLIKKSIDQ